MTRPVSYLQTDPKWSQIDYSAKGEKTTIGASGCGPTAMAMVLATWADQTVTPKTECAWALAHGYKAPRQGTYYGYFVPAAARYGLTARRLNTSNVYGNSGAPCHAEALRALSEGHLVIACMGRGNWTSSGHYVLCYKVEGNTIYINDPASTKAARTQGDYQTFKKQVKYYWVIEHPQDAAKVPEEDDDMDVNRFKELWREMRKELQDNDASAYSKEAREWAVSTGLIRGGSDAEFNGMWEDMMTREQLVTVLYRFAQMMGKA